MKNKTIFIHVPAYREPELIPTIESALKNAKYPNRLRFGICRQFKDDDGFDNVDQYRSDDRFRIADIPYNDAQGLPWARDLINTELFKDDDYILQLDSHHRFAKGWDEYLINTHKKLKKKKSDKILLAGYIPLYDPFNDPAGRTMEPWQSQFASFYPHGTIFIRPGGYIRDDKGQPLNRPIKSRFLSGHFTFGEGEWAREIRHDKDIMFSGEELNLTVRSYTHGYDMYHIPDVMIWHATMRTERDGILAWDDFSKEGKNYHAGQTRGRSKIRQLLRVSDEGFDLTGMDLGTKRSLEDYEAYAGFNFKEQWVQQYTLDNKEPHNPEASEENPWNKNFYWNINVDKSQFKQNDYQYILVAFDDANGEGVYRNDFDANRVRNMLNQNSDWYSFENVFHVPVNGARKPVKWVMWGYSASQGWAERIEGAVESDF